jgi:NADH:ubiquinone oxidoreductase subunit 3 (subunit A)
MQTTQGKPRLALSYYITILLVLLFLTGSILRKILPVDELLDVIDLIAIAILIGLVLFAIYCAWRATSDGG